MSINLFSTPILNARQYVNGELGPEALGVTALDSKTLEIKLENRTPYLLSLLKHQTAMPVPQHVVEELGDQWVKAGNMVSNGAFVLKEWIPNTHVFAEKNPLFYDAANVAVDKVYYYPTEDRSAALRSFRAGELHFNNEFPSEQFENIKKIIPGQFDVGPYNGIYYYTLNTKNPALANPAIRRALSLALNREYITEKIMREGQVPAYSFTPPGQPGYTVAEFDYKNRDQSSRLDEAVAIMSEAGYSADNRLALELKYNTSQDHQRIAQVIASQWKDIFVDVNFVTADVAIHYKDLQAGNFVVGRAGWIGDYADPQNFLSLNQAENGNNYSGYSNPQFESLMEQAAVASPEQRMALFTQAEALMLQDTPVIPIYYYVYKSLVSKDLKGHQGNIEQINRTRYFSLDN